MASTRILFVDDSELVREAVTDLFAHYEDLTLIGWSIDATDAILKAHYLRPDIVVVSTEIDDCSGFELVQFLQTELGPEKAMLFDTNYRVGTISPDLPSNGRRAIVSHVLATQLIPRLLNLAVL